MSVIPCLCLLSLFLLSFVHCHLSLTLIFFSLSPFLYIFCFSSCPHFILTTLSHICPGYRSVPAHWGSCCGHGTVLDCGWTGRPCRKNKYVYFCKHRIGELELLPDVTVSATHTHACTHADTHRKSGEWLTLCRQRPGPPPRVSEITNIPTGSCDVFQPDHLGLFSPRVQDSIWGLAALCVYSLPLMSVE